LDLIAVICPGPAKGIMPVCQAATIDGHSRTIHDDHAATLHGSRNEQFKAG
jgi:hypothetical protein